jgi:pimeloyl-ACP methyl ester carboxylesterase
MRLFASFHQAVGKDPGSLGVVVCPGLTDEHIACYRILYQLAESLAASGVSVLRFDPPGHGDSEGELADATPERVARAAALGAEVLRDRGGSERVGFLGVRLGCVGALAASNDASGGFCVAWAPILSAERYFRDLLRRQILSDVMYGGGRRSVDALLTELRDSKGTGEGIDVGGYLLTGPLYEAYSAINFPERLARARAPLLVVQRKTPSAGTPRALLEQAAKAVSCHHASDAEIFWNFPREGSVPPSPNDWLEVTRAWIIEQSGGTEVGR